MNVQPQSIEDILRELVAKDRTMLGRADEFIDALEQRVPGSLARQANPVKIALRKKVGEMLLVADGDESRREGMEKQIVELLSQDGLQQQAAQRVAEELVYAMDWKKDSPQDAQEEAGEIMDESSSSSPVVSAEQEGAMDAIPASSAWTCTCGQRNDGMFCTTCGSHRDSALPKPAVALVQAPGAAAVQEPVPPVSHAPDPTPAPVPADASVSGEGKTKPVLLAVCVLLAVAVVFLAVKSFSGNTENVAVYHDTSKPVDTEKPNETKPEQETSSIVSTDEHWIQDKDSGVYLWNPMPSEGESVTWSGGYIKDGKYLFANGPGTLTWKKDGKVIQVDNGTFEHGRHYGTFVHKFPSGRVSYSYWDHGRELDHPSNESELSLGGIAIDMSKDEVYHLLGKETEITNPDKNQHYHYQYKDMEVVITNGVVTGFVSKTDNGVTKRGIHQGSSLQDVLNAYGDSSMKFQYDRWMLYEYKFTSSKGKECLLRFAIAGNKVDYISARLLN